MKTIELFMITDKEAEKIRLLLLKAMDDTLPQVNKLESVMDTIERRMAHRAQFNEISLAIGLGPLIRPKPLNAPPATP